MCAGTMLSIDTFLFAASTCIQCIHYGFFTKYYVLYMYSGIIYYMSVPMHSISDLAGHGPFSHMYEGFIKKTRPDSSWEVKYF